MLTHQIPCINVLNSTQFKPFILAIFHAINTWTFWSNQCKPGLFLTVPKQAVGCPWAVRVHGHFRPHTHKIIIYCINYHTSRPNSLWTVQNGLQKFSHFGPKIWDRSNGHSRPQINPTINKTLKSRVNQVGENPYLSGVCRNSPKPIPTRSLFRGKQLCFLSRRKPTVRSPGILERR